MIVVAGPIGALAALAVGAYYSLSAVGRESMDDAIGGASIVHVAPQVAGRVLRVLVADDQPVQAGDLLVEIDPEDFAATLVESSASAAEARGRLEQAHWQLLVAKAERTMAAADLVAAGYRGRNAADERTAELELTMAQAKQVAAEAQVHLARAQIDTAAAGVLAAQVAAERARIRLAHTKIHAPRTGRVRTRSVEPGDYVQVGQELLAVGSDDLGSPATARPRFGPTPPAPKPPAVAPRVVYAALEP